MPDECLREMKGKQNQPIINLLTTGTPCGISAVISCEDFSKLTKLLRVTAYVLRFCEILKNRVKGMSRQGIVKLTAPEIAAADQVPLRENKLFKVWEKQLGVFLSGVLQGYRLIMLISLRQLNTLYY